MNFALVYLVRRYMFRIGDFFNHWYVDASRWFVERFFNALRTIDQTVAIRITLRHFFEPLYRDYSIVGILLGPIFRSMRALIGIIIYVFVVALFTFAYILWLLIPVGILGIVIFYCYVP